jgi:uncharacterized protein (TIGR02246 family)
MTEPISSTDRTDIEEIIWKLEAAWNAGDGVAFAAPFAKDADFVNIRADRFSGRETIAAGHDGIFRTIYAGSTNRLAVESVRLLREDVVVAHVRAELTAPSGPLSGKHVAIFSAVLTRAENGWEIATFHNTLMPPADGARP